MKKKDKLDLIVERGKKRLEKSYKPKQFEKWDKSFKEPDERYSIRISNRYRRAD
jgi:hypothetical protein